MLNISCAWGGRGVDERKRVKEEIVKAPIGSSGEWIGLESFALMMEKEM